MKKKALLMILGLLLLIFGTCANITRAYASTGVTIAAGSDNGYVYIYDKAGTLLWSYYTGANVASVAVSSDGAYIAVGSLGNKLYLFARDGTKLWEKAVPISYGGAGNGEESKSVAISAYGEYVVAGCADKLYVYKKDGTLHWSHTGQETCVDISLNATYVVACNKNDGTIDFFSILSNTPLWTKNIGAFWVATSNPGYVIASSSSNAYMFDNAGTQLWSYVLDRGGIVRVDMSEDGLTAIAVNDDPGDVACYIWYFNLSGLVWKYTPCPPQHDFYSGSISADGNIISMGPGNIGGIYVFSRDGTSLQTMPQSSWVQSVDLTSDGQFGVWGDRTYGTVWFFSKDSSTPLWSKTVGGKVHAVAIATYLAEEWPMFHHDPCHTGYSTSTAPNTNNVLWSYQTGGEVWFSSPAVVDGRVYVGSSDDNVYCLNATNGAYIWLFRTYQPVISSPAVADGKVYIGALDVAGTNGWMYCLNAANGAYIWGFKTGYRVWGPPVVADGKVYFGCFDNNVYCLNATNGAYIWSYTTNAMMYSSPAVVDGRVYVGPDDNNVYCLNATNGAYIWSYLIYGGSYASSPAVADGRVYVGSGEYHGELYCLNATNGAYIWKYQAGLRNLAGSPAIANGRVYVGSWDGKVYCAKASTGEHIWSYTTGSYVESSPAVADGKVYLGSDDNNVYCLNASNGDYIWSYTTNNRVQSSPAVAYGKVYIGSGDGKVYAFEDPIYTLTITTTTGGTTNPPPGTHTYYEGRTVTVTAMLNPNYQLDHWELDGSNAGSANPISVFMNTNHALKAFFAYSPPPPVGGVIVPSDKLDLLAPYIGLASTITVATVAAAIYVKRVKHRKEKQ